MIRSVELLALLARGFSLKTRQSHQVITLYNPAGEIANDVPSDVIEKLLSEGLISVTAEEPERIYALTEKARMLLSWPL